MRHTEVRGMYDFRLGKHAGYWKAIWQEPGYGQRRATLYDEFRRAIKETEPKERAERAFHTWIDNVSRALIPKSPTIGEILDGYVEYRKPNVADPDRLKYAKLALEPLHQKMPETINIQLCREYTALRRVRELPGGRIGTRSDGTINYELNMLLSAIRWAVEYKWIQLIPEDWKNNLPVMEIPDKPPPKDRWLTREEYQILIGATKSQHIRLFIIIGLTTAARKEAILELTWDRVDLDNRLIDFNTPIRKITSKKRAIVPINDTLHKALIEAKGKSTCDYVIEYAGGRVKDVKKGVALTVERAALKGVSPHVLRHTAATWMAQQGVPLDTHVSNYLGHTDSRTTRKYIHHQPGFLKGAAEALEL